MERDLTGKLALITGGGRGIGKAIALMFARHGARVIVSSRDRNTLEKTAVELKSTGAEALALEVDLTRPDSVKALAARVESGFGRLDILVNNSGVSGMTPIRAGNDDLWFEIIDTNLNGMYLATRCLVPLMPDGGRIINIASVLGKFGVPGYSAYCASKHGVIGFTRALSAELAPQKITVNAICPGWVDTEMARVGITQIAAHTGMSEEEFRAEAMSRVPLGRFVETDEVAALALYLASSESSAMTGQALNICGGATTQ